jgi:hypothetical protein
LHVGTFGPDGKLDGEAKRLGRRASSPAGASFHGLPVALLTFEG